MGLLVWEISVNESVGTLNSGRRCRLSAHLLEQLFRKFVAILNRRQLFQLGPNLMSIEREDNQCPTDLCVHTVCSVPSVRIALRDSIHIFDIFLIIHLHDFSVCMLAD